MRNDEMSSASFLSRWMRLRSAASANDWGDQGTAFGLDLSMQGGVPSEPEAARRGARPTPAEGWLARLRRRP
jgi:hypothetical protein